MDKEEVTILRREQNYVAQEVARSGRFADIIYELREREVLQSEYTLLMLNSELTKTSRMYSILQHLETCRPDTFQIFIEVLIQYGLSHIANRLDPRAFERHPGIIGGEIDRLDAERLPDFHGVGEPIPNTGPLPPLPRPYSIPSLPPRSSAHGSFGSPDSNGNNNADMKKTLKIDVIPAAEYGGSRMDESLLYRNQSMPRGLVFLANYKNFLNGAHPVRDGSEIDVKNLCLLFYQMGYKVVPQVHLDLTKYDTIKALREFKNLQEQETVDSCIVVIMSHGRDGRSFYTSDNNYLTVNDVVERFNNQECEALKGKPKIFIFQYCRGSTCDVGVAPVPKHVKGDGGLIVETDAGYTSVVDRDPTFTDMYIVYSTVEGFVSFRHPDRGSWLMEAICEVFMKYAHNEELDALMKRVSRQLRRNLTDEGNKQVCEFVQRAFDRHFFFNPQPLNSTERLNMRSLMESLSESAESLEGCGSPLTGRTSRYQQHHLRPLSWSRGSTPELYNSPVRDRHRNLSGASNSSDYNAYEVDPAFLTSGNIIIHPRARRRSGNARLLSENLQFLQPSHLPGPLESFNRSFSENVLASETITSNGNGTTDEPAEAYSPPQRLTIDTVDNPQGASAVPITEAVVEKADVNMNQAIDREPEESPRHCIKRQLSIPSTGETLTKINDVKKFLQVHDSDPKLIERLQRVESFVNKKKNEGKRRRKDESSSLEY